MTRWLSATAAALVLLGSGAVAAGASPVERGRPGDGGPATVAVTPVGTYRTGTFDQSAAEIVAHDPRTQRLFVVNAARGSVDVLDIGDPANPDKRFELATAGVPAADGSAVAGGSKANSVAVRGDLVAVAVEPADKVTPGWVVFFTVDGEALNALRVGSLPDMVTFTPDGRTLLVANEGEPADDYSVDPEGTVSVIDVRRDARQLTQADVRTATFHAWDDGAKALDPKVRVFGPLTNPDRRVSENLEPEYIEVEPRGRTAYVVLQEANAMAVLDVASATFTGIWPFGYKDHLLPGNELDVSDRDGAIRIGNWPVWGMYQPDGFASYQWRGQTLLVTANEGDSRAWSGYSEEARFRAWSAGRGVCPGSRLDQWLGGANAQGVASLEALRDDARLGRLTVTTTMGLGGDGCLADVYAFGGRSFSIWTADGRQLHDSGSDFERITAERFPQFFNSNHRENRFDTRSDDKGPEPEDVAIGTVAGRTYAFIALERIGGLMIYDITDPRRVSFVDYVNNRDFSAPPGSPEAGDLGAENVVFIEAGRSPIRGVPMLAVANEVSGTTTLFRVDRVTPGR
jgi:DNA-binding beta-propeller fold protein YncE